VGISHGKTSTDILDVSNTTVLGPGFFLNGANTLRQSVEASITLKSNPVSNIPRHRLKTGIEYACHR
jgi:hypothetical protein